MEILKIKKSISQTASIPISPLVQRHFALGVSRSQPNPMGSHYSLNMMKGTRLSLDYQYIANPAYNADRGSVRIIGRRLHLEY